MVTYTPSLPAGTDLNSGSRLRFICELRRHVFAAWGVHGRGDDYEVCARCGLRQTLDHPTPWAKRYIGWFRLDLPWWWHGRTVGRGTRTPRQTRWWDHMVEATR